MAAHSAGLTGHTDTVHSVAFSPDGQTLASGSDDNTVRLWNVSSPRHAKPLGAPLTGHTGPLWSVAFSPDGNMLAAGSADSTASLWNVSDPAYPSQVGEPLALAVHGAPHLVEGQRGDGGAVHRTPPEAVRCSNQSSSSG